MLVLFDVDHSLYAIKGGGGGGGGERREGVRPLPKCLHSPYWDCLTIYSRSYTTHCMAITKLKVSQMQLSHRRYLASGRRLQYCTVTFRFQVALPLNLRVQLYIPSEPNLLHKYLLPRFSHNLSLYARIDTCSSCKLYVPWCFPIIIEAYAFGNSKSLLRLPHTVFSLRHQTTRICHEGKCGDWVTCVMARPLSCLLVDCGFWVSYILKVATK